MNTRTSTARRLLPFALACGLFVVAASASEAQGCADLFVFVGTTGADTITMKGTPSCDHGFFIAASAPNGEISPGESLVVVVRQSSFYGPACQITLGGPDGATAVISVQQNYCGAEAGDITASVVSGPATFVTDVTGSYANNLPGLAWFTVDF